MMTNAPKPYLASTPEVCQLLGVTRQTVAAWRAQGCPVHKRGKAGAGNIYNVPDVIAWTLSRARQSRPADGTEGAKLRKLEAAASLAELALQREREGLVLRADAEAIVAESFDKVRRRVQAIPAKVAPLVALQMEAAACMSILQDEVIAALTELSGGPAEPDA